MSKIGRMPIILKNGTTATVDQQIVTVKGPKGELTLTVPSGVRVTLENDRIIVQQENTNDRTVRPLFGLTRANLANMAKGVDSGFEKKLELVGVGYRAQMQGADLQLSLGFSHPVKFKARPGLTLAVADNTVIISGVDKAMVGELAAEIRAVRPPEPYKGKGIKYAGEYIRRKAGKAAKAVGAAK